MAKPYFNPALIINTIEEVQRHYGLDNMKDKKARTNGGEYEGPCPHCKMLGYAPDGGKNRLVVWQNRPVTGGAPCFYCRICGGDGRFSEKWTGDLPHFLMDTMHLGFVEALDFLEIPDEYRKDLDSGPQSFAPSRRAVLQRAPALEWRNPAEGFLGTSEGHLWGNRGARRLEKLMLERGLSEKLLRFARIGYNPCEEWVDGWGKEGRIKLPRGYVIPEYQYDFKSKELVLWSIAIRRLQEDLDNEFLETGKEGNKYHVIGGSERGLYMSYTALPDELGRQKLVVLTEGYFDALAVLEATNFEYGAVATQTARGAQYPQWVNFMKEHPALTLIVPDVDKNKAGSELSKYWATQLGDEATICKLKGFKDPSDMHSNGNDIASWLKQSAQQYYRFRRTRYAQEVKEELKPVTMPPIEEKRSTVILEPATLIVEELPSIEEIKNEVGTCVKCGGCGKYTDKLGNTWCSKDFACVQLIDFGFEWGYKELLYPAGYGLVDPELVQWDQVWNEDPGPGYEYVEGGRIGGSRVAYKKFCMEADPASVWLAAREARRNLTGLFEPKKNEQKIILQYPCANKQCKFDRSKPHYPEGEPYMSYGKLVWPEGKPGPEYHGVSTWGTLHWCPRCTMCHKFLLLCEELGFPGQEQYISIKLAPGKEAAIAYAREQKLFTVMYAFDILVQDHAGLRMEILSR